VTFKELRAKINSSKNNKEKEAATNTRKFPF
jgi:hypothetical protein